MKTHTRTQHTRTHRYAEWQSHARWSGVHSSSSYLQVTWASWLRPPSPAPLDLRSVAQRRPRGPCGPLTASTPACVGCSHAVATHSAAKGDHLTLTGSLRWSTSSVPCPHAPTQDESSVLGSSHGTDTQLRTLSRSRHTLPPRSPPSHESPSDVRTPCGSWARRSPRPPRSHSSRRRCSLSAHPQGTHTAHALTTV